MPDDGRQQAVASRFAKVLGSPSPSLDEESRLVPVRFFFVLIFLALRAGPRSSPTSTWTIHSASSVVMRNLSSLETNYGSCCYRYADMADAPMHPWNTNFIHSYLSRCRIAPALDSAFGGAASRAMERRHDSKPPAQDP